VERSPDDLREVANYVVALEHGMARLKELPICVRLIKELHENLMTDVRGHHATRGEFRKIQNWIGRPGCTLETASFVPPPPEEVEPCLAAWEKFLHESELPPLITIALAHYQFEAIHPFLDGNGRVGRLLITLFLMESGILPAPLLYLSAFFEASRRDYYDGLRRISERAEWRDWLEYFLLAVARMSEDAINRAGRINAKLAQWQKDVAGESTKTPMQALELLAANPFTTAKGLAQKLGVAFTTAQRAIGRLERLPELHPVPVAVLDPGEATVAFIHALRVDPDASGGEVHQERVEVVDAVVDHHRLVPLTEVGRVLREWIPGRHARPLRHVVLPHEGRAVVADLDAEGLTGLLAHGHGQRFGQPGQDW